ncbi:DEAD/DEAH box helicase family protein [Campylobacter helveticus]|uniref:Helicase/UvrB N-terminal domain-containing protein n=1 Tax=Campylobacter helveticus TaxID=28898 RepID=A0AAX2UH40_9BACT|nr:DEAD/DEAH box helicase family protein [Campylobacter helveticus]QBL11813.1 hypothetical protein A0073_04785 [Campylobacter helveticus]TNB54273.1 hypothetical protein FDW47_08395 [Campylobacter helveticus]TNB55514.1 hypothetical protein FDW44_09225 [Campylobacter helveticus]TNB55648.1 hypothetical protein FDW42_08875 [Campylobacter helveticus]TNB59453.1 hypothetical protein FDR72_08280 [Campylobacter helveticus]
MKLEDFPSPDKLYENYKVWKNLKEDSILKTKFDNTNIEKPLRYYQRVAVNETLAAVQKGAMRALLVLATGTGKTQVAYQIAHRLFN